MTAVVHHYWTLIVGVVTLLVGAFVPGFSEQVSNLLVVIGTFFGVTSGGVVIHRAMTGGKAS